MRLKGEGTSLEVNPPAKEAMDVHLGASMASWAAQNLRLAGTPVGHLFA